MDNFYFSCSACARRHQGVSVPLRSNRMSEQPYVTTVRVPDARCLTRPPPPPPRHPHPLPTYEQSGERAQVAGAAADVEERHGRPQLQRLEHLGVDTRRRQVQVAVLPGEVAVRVLAVLGDVVACAVDRTQDALHPLRLHVVRLDQVVHQLVVAVARTRDAHL